MTKPQPTPRQTLSYLRQLFDERGIRAKSKLGQNFLTDLNIIDLIVRTAELTKEDLIIEVGSGTASLTVKLAEEAGAVLTVEIDAAFAQLAGEMIENLDNVTLHHGDILRSKNDLNDEVLETLQKLRESSSASKLKLVANLPYSVATPVISNFLLTDLPFERMVVTVQWEIGERLIAQPSTKDYGALAILVQSIADVTMVRELPPTVFWPRPQVDSAIMLIRPNAQKREHVGDPKRFRVFLRDLYVHRRKNLRGALSSMPDVKLSKSEIDEKLAELGVETTVRAEALDIETHLRLCAAFSPE